MAEMFWKQRVAVLMEGRPPSSTGLPSLSPAMRRRALRHFSVDLALSWKAIGMGSWQEAVQIWILLGCSSRFMTRVAMEMSSIAAGMCCGFIQMYQSSR